MAGSSAAEVSRPIADLALRSGERGLSLWEYGQPDDEQHRLIVAALTCERFRRLGLGKVDKIDFLPVDRHVVDEIGSIVVTPGETPVPRANQLHRELQWAPADLEKLARELFAAGTEVSRISATRVRGIVSWLDPADVDDDEIREWLAAHR